MAAVLGFPLALLFAWRFNIEAGHIMRTPGSPMREAQSLGRSDYFLLTLLSLAMLSMSGVLVWKILQTRDTPAASPTTASYKLKSIAILPFENMSGDTLNQPFTRGIHDDLLTHISKISDIKVISRTSVARLDSSMSIPAIGALLGVATVLEGGVQRQGEQLRINVQLIDAASDQHLWAETYDRRLTTQNIFQIQTDIARAITRELQVTLSLRDRESLEKSPTQNLDAYEDYLLGKQHMSMRSATSLGTALEYFSSAIDADPAYAHAYLGLADTQIILASYGYAPIQAARETAANAIEKALMLDDQLGAAYASRGLVFSNQGNFVAAEQAFMRSIELDPNYASAFHWFGDMLVNVTFEAGRAVPFLEKARELDPLSSVINLTLGEAYEAVGRFDEARDMYRKSIEIEPDFASGYFRMAALARTVDGALDEAVRWHREELFRDPARDASFLGYGYLELGDAETAEMWFERALKVSPQSFFSNAGPVFLNWYRGDEDAMLAAARLLLELFPGNNVTLVALVKFGRYQEALDSVFGAYPELSCDREPVINRINFSQSINFSLALEKTGMQECAKRMLKGAYLSLAELQRFGWQGSFFSDVEIYARLGQKQNAIAALRKAIEAGLRVGWWSQVEQSPHTESLLGDADFQALVDLIRVDMAAQLERVSEMESRGELAPVSRDQR